MDSKEGFRVNEAERLDGVVWSWREEANGVEEVTDYVFLSQPAVLTVVVEGGVGCGFVYQLLSCEWVAKWYHKVQCPSKDGIYGLQQAEKEQEKIIRCAKRHD
jgi:hypothetical protein